MLFVVVVVVVVAVVVVRLRRISGAFYGTGDEVSYQLSAISYQLSVVP